MCCRSRAEPSKIRYTTVGVTRPLVWMVKGSVSATVGAIGVEVAAPQIGDAGPHAGRIHCESGRMASLRSYCRDRKVPCKRTPELRTLGLALAGALALMAPVAAHSASLGSNMERAMTGPVLAVMQVGDGHGSNWHPAPGAGSGGWNAPHSGPSRFNSGPYWGPGVPNYYVWVPGSAIFDDPFPDWRGPTGGWGNP